MIQGDRQSLRSSLYSSRKKIFQQWPKPQSHTKIIDRKTIKKDKVRQSTRAQQLLQRSLNTINNIEYFLQIKKRYKNDQVSLQGYLDDQTKQLQILNNRQKQFNSFQYGKCLFNYYQNLRRNQQLLKSMQCFSLANLANYDPNHTKIQFTRPFDQAQKDLLTWINRTKQLRVNLQQSLVIYEYQIPQSTVLGQDQSFDFCFHQLNWAMKSQNIIKVHYLMIYQIKDLQKLIERQKYVVKEAEITYAKHEALLDSLQLMQAHTQQMKRDQQILKNTFDGLAVQNAMIIIPKGSQNEDILDKNLKIYKSNKQNFVRYQAQTDMDIFRQRRQKYTDQLNKYQKSFTNWKKSQQKAEFLYQRQKKLKTFKQKASLGDKSNFTTNQKQAILDSYYQVLQCQIPKNLPNIKSYKYNLCGQMQSSISSNGIPLSKRENAFQDKKQDVLRRYVQFFAALQYKNKSDKVNYLTQRKDLIGVLKYQLQQLQRKEKNYQTEKYRVGLLYAQKIVQCQQFSRKNKVLKNQADFRQFCDDFDQIRKLRWRGLPQGFQTVLYNYINDLRIYNMGIIHLQRFQQVMNNFKQRLNTQLADATDRKIYTEGNQSPYICMDPINHNQNQQFFKQIARKMSLQNIQLKDNIVKLFWMQPQNTIKSSYQRHFKGFKDINFTSIQKKQFFTFKILSFMILSGKNLKVPNIEEMCVFYMEQFQRGFYQWNNDRRYLQIIKIFFFKQYLEDILSKHIQTKIYVEMCQYMIRFSILMYQCKLYIDNAKQTVEDINYGLQIYKDLFQFKIKFSSTEKINIQQKLEATIKSLRKMPVIIGTKRIYQAFCPLFDSNSCFKQLKEAQKNRHKYQSQFLARVYCITERLNQFLKANQLIYQPYENVSVKDKNQIIYYLKNLSQKNSKSAEIISSLLIKIRKIFKDRNDHQIIKLKDGLQQSILLQEIITRLERI